MTKGLSFRNLVSFTRARFGEEGWAQLEATLSESDRRTLAEMIPMGWYELELYARLVRQLVEVHGRGERTLVEDYGRYSAEHDLTTIHKLLMKAVNPGVIMEQSMKLWRRFQDTGTWRVERGEHRATGMLLDWGCVDEALCRELVGYLEYLLTLGYGGKRARVEHPRCRARSAPACVFVCTWE